LLAKWFMRLQNISKIFKVSSNPVSTKRVTSKKKMACMCNLRTFRGQTRMIRVRKRKSYGRYGTMILFHVSWIWLDLDWLLQLWFLLGTFGTATWVVPSHCFAPGPHPVERTGFSTESGLRRFSKSLIYILYILAFFQSYISIHFCTYVLYINIMNHDRVSPCFTSATIFPTRWPPCSEKKQPVCFKSLEDTDMQ